VALNFEVELLSGEPGLSNETTGVDWFPINTALEMDLFHGHDDHIRDALAGKDEAIFARIRQPEEYILLHGKLGQIRL